MHSWLKLHASQPLYNQNHHSSQVLTTLSKIFFSYQPTATPSPPTPILFYGKKSKWYAASDLAKAKSSSAVQQHEVYESEHGQVCSEWRGSSNHTVTRISFAAY
jgi:hypothetical protein